MTYSLSGSGTQALSSGTGALRIYVTTLPAIATQGNANPPNLYGIGLIRQGDGTSWWRAESIEAEHMLLPLLQGTTEIGYSLLHGATIDVDEVIETSPFYPPSSGGSGGLYSAYLCYNEQQSSGTNGGTFTNGAWRTRVLNTEVADLSDHGALAANQITLDTGAYRVFATGPTFGVGRNQLRIQNVTDNLTLVIGGNMYSTGTDGPTAVLQGRFTIAAAKAIELQHRCEVTSATLGLGVATGWGTEVYASIELWRES